MHSEIEGKWIDCFVTVFDLCKIRPGDTVAILSETQSRSLNVKLAELALARMKAKAFHVVMPTPPQSEMIPVRSTGASEALQHIGPAINALAASSFVVDLTVEGLLHAPERSEILAQGTRILMISNEHPEVLERLRPDPALKPKVAAAVELANRSRSMHVASKAGTDLSVDLADSQTIGNWGVVEEPGRMAHWPGGLCAFFPRAGAVRGRIVLDEGDINLTFKRYLESPISLTIEDDFITRIEGNGLDADLMRSYFEAWGDRNAYATAHLGWGMNERARWDAMVMYDRDDLNGTEQRVFGGNFLFSTGSNQFANRFTLGHFDLPMRNCTIRLDDNIIVEQGRLTSAFV